MQFHTAQKYFLSSLLFAMALVLGIIRISVLVFWIFCRRLGLLGHWFRSILWFTGCLVASVLIIHVLIIFFLSFLTIIMNISTSAIATSVFLSEMFFLLFLLLRILVHSSSLKMCSNIIDFGCCTSFLLLSSHLLRWMFSIRPSLSYTSWPKPCLFNNLFFFLWILGRVLIDYITFNNGCICLIYNILALHRIFPSKKFIICARFLLRFCCRRRGLTWCVWHQIFNI